MKLLTQMGGTTDRGTDGQTNVHGTTDMHRRTDRNRERQHKVFIFRREKNGKTLY